MLKFENGTYAEKTMSPLEASKAMLKPGTPLLIRIDGMGDWVQVLFIMNLLDKGIEVLGMFKGTVITSLSSKKTRIQVLDCDVTIYFEEKR